MNELNYSPEAKNDLLDIKEYISAEGNDIYINRVLFGRRDYCTILFDSSAQDEAED